MGYLSTTFSLREETEKVEDHQGPQGTGHHDSEARNEDRSVVKEEIHGHGFERDGKSIFYVY